MKQWCCKSHYSCNWFTFGYGLPSQLN